MLKTPKNTRPKRPVVSNELKPELVFLRGGNPHAAGGDLHAAIKEILEQPKARCAVAFWGQGSEKLVTGTGSRVICNLRTGGTNPYALKKVNAELRQSDYLHAKVYIGRTEAVVASANASANGLGLEDVEQACWIEAGVRLSDIGPVSDWFEALWEQSREISREDWDAAKKAWRGRQRVKPPVITFADFNATAPVLPLMTWLNADDWETCPASITRQLGRYDETIKRRIDDGIELEHPDDEAVMKDRWVLCWTRGKAGFPRKGSKLWWLRLSNEVVLKGFRFVGQRKARDVVLGVEQMPPVPFDAGEAKFVEALREVLARDEYKPLREDGYTGAWFEPRAELMAKLWRDVKAVYEKIP